MDISTGHMVLSYMEDHLKNKQRLEQEWVGLCAYEAEPNSTSIAFKVQSNYPSIWIQNEMHFIKIYQIFALGILSHWSQWTFPPKFNLSVRFQRGNLFEYGFNLSSQYLQLQLQLYFSPRLKTRRRTVTPTNSPMTTTEFFSMPWSMVQILTTSMHLLW